MPGSKTRTASRWRSALLWLSAVVVAAGVASCSRGLTDSKAQTSGVPHAQTISVPVDGMSCVSCAARVRRTLKGIEGVQQVEVSLERREAVVRFSPQKVSPERLESAINGLAYKAGKSRVMEAK